MQETDLSRTREGLIWCQVGSWCWLVGWLGIGLAFALGSALRVSPSHFVCVFGLVLLFGLLAGGVGLWQLQRISDSLGRNFGLLSALCLATTVPAGYAWLTAAPGSHDLLLSELFRLLFVLSVLFFEMLLLRLSAQLDSRPTFGMILALIAGLLLALGGSMKLCLATVLVASLALPVLLGRLTGALDCRLDQG